MTPTSWSDWVSGDWLRRMTWPSVPSFEGSLGAVSRFISGGRGSAAAGSPAAMLQRLLDAVGTKVLGRLISVVTSRYEVSLVLDEVTLKPSSLELALGHLGDVHVSARDVSWSGRRVDSVDITAKNVHIHPGANVVVVAAPVNVTATVSESHLDDWVRASRHARLTLTDDAIVIM